VTDLAGYILLKVSDVTRAQWALRSATSLARTVRVKGRPKVQNEGTLIIGDRVKLVSTVAALELAVGLGSKLEIGDRSFINYGTAISALSSVQIGPRCLIGTYCLIMDNAFHRLEPDRRMERPESGPAVLEENVWLGARVIVMAGVTIGADSAVGAGSVVTRDVSPGSVAAGVPARVVRDL
jgi:acetyltransferase-like isoleucine patch superfamily enzyme